MKTTLRTALGAVLLAFALFATAQAQIGATQTIQRPDYVSLAAVHPGNLTANAVAVVADLTRGGTFAWRTGDQSANVTADAAQCVWLAPAAASSGATGAWQRQYAGPFHAQWCGSLSSAYAATMATAIARAGVGAVIDIAPGAYTQTATLTPLTNQTIRCQYETTITKGANIDLYDLSASGSKLVGCRYEGAGAAANGGRTGRGVVINSGTDQRILGAKFYDCNGFCLEFTANDAGLRFNSEDAVYRRSVDISGYDTTVYAIKLPATDTNGNRFFDRVYAEGGALIDLGGSANTRLTNSSMTTMSMGAAASRAVIADNRMASLGTTLTFQGNDNSFTGNIIAGPVTLGGSDNSFVGNVVAGNIVVATSAARLHVTGNEYGTNVIVDNQTAAGTSLSRIYDYRSSVTPSWGADTTNPTIGNGTLNAQIQREGRFAYVTITMSAGSTTTTGSGDWYFTLPAPFSAWTAFGTAQGTFRILDNGVGYRVGSCRMGSGSNQIRCYIDGQSVGVRSTTLPSWDAGDNIEIGLPIALN